MNAFLGALCLAALPLLAAAQPAPPDLSQLPPPAAASAPEPAASAPLKRRCVAGCDGQAVRISWSEDAHNRFEEHRNEKGEVVKLFVHPKNGAPKYEVLLGLERSRQTQKAHVEGANPEGLRRDGQAVWRLKEF